MTTTFPEQLATIRHDLRTPIGHIIGYSEMLLEDMEEDSQAGLSVILDKIHTTGDLLKNLVDESLGESVENESDLELDQVRASFAAHLSRLEDWCVELRGVAEERSSDDLIPDIGNIHKATRVLTGLVNDRLQTACFSVLPSENDTDAETDTTPVETPILGKIEASALAEGGDILIVDDDGANRDLLSRRLQRQGYDTVVRDGGQSALKFLQTEKIDLILLDMMMPEMSGLEVLDILKKDRRLKNIPVIMLSALDDVNQIVQCILMGAEDYIFKPFNPVLLKARIGASLEKIRLREQTVGTLRVFVSSASDVTPERKVVKQVLRGLNDEFTGLIRLIPYLWEDEPLLGSETAQTQVIEPRDTDIYVAIFWARMGTPLPGHIRRPDGSRYDSGTEYEYEDALNACRSGGKPEMLVYRKMSEPMVSLSDRETLMECLSQKERLELFFRRWFQTESGEIMATYHAFELGDELETLLEEHLRKLLLKRLSAKGD